MTSFWKAKYIDYPLECVAAAKEARGPSHQRELTPHPHSDTTLCLNRQKEVAAESRETSNINLNWLGEMHDIQLR